MLDWIRYILYTGADEHGNQPVLNRTSGRHLHQGGSSWTTTPAAAVPAQRTGTQPCTHHLRCLWSNLSPKAHPWACWTAGKERRHPHQPQSQDKSSAYPVLWLISKQPPTEYISKIIQESDGHHGETLSVGTGNQLCPMQPSRDCRRESLSHQSQETAKDLGQRILPFVLQVAIMKLVYFSAASNRQIMPILRRRDTLDLLQGSSQQNFWQLKQKQVS